MNYDQWAESLQKDVYDYWKENHRDWEAGFRVFYGPVFSEPEVLILGFQPGGPPGDFARDHLDRYQDGDFSVPDTNEYLKNDYRIAKQMRTKVFEGHQNILKQSIKSNVIFFRAKDLDTWAEVPKAERKEMESFSLKKVDEMIETLDPNTVLIEGMKTWDLIKSRVGFNDECLARRSNARLLCVSEDQDRTYVGIIHPSTRVSDENWSKVKTELIPILTQC